MYILETWNNIIDFISSVANHFNQYPWYRGQDVDSWDLLPSVKRKPFCLKKEYEQYLSTDFYIEAKKRLKETPKELSGWISLMQHYGLPTRLLDWSESPFVALYFAVSDINYDGEDATLWCLNPVKLNSHLKNSGISKEKMDYLFPMDYYTVIKLIKPAFKPIHATDQIIACHSVENDLRMYVQKSAFTVHDSDIPLNKQTYSSELLIKAVIPKSRKIYFRKTLDICGYTLSNIYPDVEHISKELKDRFSH